MILIRVSNITFLILLLFSSCAKKRSNNTAPLIKVDTTIVVCENFKGYKRITKDHFVVFNSLADFSDKNGVFVFNFKDSQIPIMINIEDRTFCAEAPMICSDIRPIVICDGDTIVCNPIVYTPVSGVLKIVKKGNLIKMTLKNVNWRNEKNNLRIKTNIKFFSLMFQIISP